MARIGIFGGSFNPPHLGHILAVREFRRKLALDKVLLIPASIPPHKRLSANSPGARARLEMTRLAVQGLQDVEVSDIELNRTGTSYTADTLAELKLQYPNDDLFLLIGTDMFLSFERWHCPESITSAATLAVAHRDRDCLQTLTDCAERLKERFSAEVILIPNDYLAISSTSVRAMLAFGFAEQYLAPQVFDYIRKNRLYYVGDDLKKLPFERLKEVSLSLHKDKRVRHVIGCSDTAVRLAVRYGEDPSIARRAGILHDITKALTDDEQLQLCEKYDIILSQLERENPKLLHAKTGAAVAREVFGESEAVWRAIHWHTTARVGMTTMEKILYLADYMEPNRDFEGVEELRRLTDCSLDAALRLGLQMSVEQLTRRKMEIDPNSLAALYSLEDKQ